MAEPTTNPDPAPDLTSPALEAVCPVAAPVPAMAQAPAIDAPVLLVDDDPKNLVALRAVLDRDGHRLLEARSGQETLAIAAREELAAIVLDVRMPGMSGLEVARALKRSERTRSIPIIFVTAWEGDVQHVYAAYSIGAVDYLVKPLDLMALRCKVSIFVELFRQRRELERQAEAIRAAERREWELKLKELQVASDERYHKLVEGIDHVLAWSADPATLTLTFICKKAQAIFGCATEELGRPGFWLERMFAEEREPFREVVRQVLADGKDRTYDHRLTCANGQTRWFHTGLSVVHAPGGGSELHGVSTDVTHLRPSVEAQRRQQVLTNVSRELLTQAQVIAGAAEVLQEAGELDGALGKVVETIVRERDRAERLAERVAGLDVA